MSNFKLQRLHADSWNHWNTAGIRETSYETLDYAVGIGCVTIEDQQRGQVAYMLVNKLTGVIEYSSSLLPEVLANMRAIQAGLNEERGKMSASPKMPKN